MFVKCIPILQDVSDDVISSRAITISIILQDYQQLSESALYNCSLALTTTIFEYGMLCSKDSTINYILSALSAIVESGRSLPQFIAYQVRASMDNLLAARKKLLAIAEETSIVTDNLRFYSTVSYLIDILDQPIPSPQSITELYLKKRPTITTINILNTTSSMKSAVVKVDSNDAESILTPTSTSSVASHQYVRNKNKSKRLLKSRSGGGFSSIDYGSLGASQSQDNQNYFHTDKNFSGNVKAVVEYDEEAHITIVTTTISLDSPTHYYVIPPQNSSIHCRNTGKPYSVSANCSMDKSLNVTCHGNDTNIISFTCPGVTFLPVCYSFDSSADQFAETPACVLVDYSDYNVTCECTGPSGYEGEVVEPPVIVNPITDDIAASAKLEIDSFVTTYSSAKHLTADTVADNPVMSIIVS